MLHDDDVHALVEARHPDPFAVLGMHAEADGALTRILEFENEQSSHRDVIAMPMADRY